MRLFIFALMGLLFVPVLGKAVNCPAYQFTCVPVAGFLEARVIDIKNCQSFMEPFHEDNDQKVKELLEQNIHPLIPGADLATKTCNLHDHTFEITARAIDNYVESPSYCSLQGPSLSLSVKKGAKEVIKDVEFVNGCWEDYQIRGMRYYHDNSPENMRSLSFDAVSSDRISYSDLNLDIYFESDNMKDTVTNKVLKEAIENKLMKLHQQYKMEFKYPNN